MTEYLPVIQDDRDRVQAFHSAMLDRLMNAVKNKEVSKRFGKDEGDHGELVQAFAACRLAYSPTPSNDTLQGRGEVLAELERQMEAQDENLPSSLARERGLVWLEGWFDLVSALQKETRHDG